LHRVFENLQKEYGFTTIHGGKSPMTISREIRAKIEKILSSERSAMAHEISSVSSIHSDDHPA
jgi:hypothetical protein